MTADDYSLCITHVLIFINKELVLHVHAKLIGLFTTPHPNISSLCVGVLFFKKKKFFFLKRLLFQFHKTEKIRLLPVCEAPPAVLSKGHICCQYLTCSS